jgi:hypothetical protein
MNKGVKTILKQIEALQKLEKEGVKIGWIALQVGVMKDGKVTEIHVDTNGTASVIGANNNSYHHTKNAYDSYHKHLEKTAEAIRKGQKHLEAANDLIRVLDSVAAKAEGVIRNMPGWPHHLRKCKYTTGGQTVWITEPGKFYYESVGVCHCPIKNKFRFFSRSGYMPTKSDKNWVTPMKFLEKLGARPEMAKILADPTIGAQ